MKSWCGRLGLSQAMFNNFNTDDASPRGFVT